MIYGYARVSTEGQCLDRQIDALVKAGVDAENIYKEKITGTKASRPKLNALLNVVQEGDIVVIEALNRLGRSSSDLIALMKSLNDKGIILKSLKESLDFSTVQGQFIANFLALMADFERAVIVDRVRAGLESARQRGRVGGRPKTSEKVISRAIDMYRKQALTVTDICKICQISRTTLYKALHEYEDKEELKGINNK